MTRSLTVFITLAILGGRITRFLRRKKPTFVCIFPTNYHKIVHFCIGEISLTFWVTPFNRSTLSVGEVASHVQNVF